MHLTRRELLAGVAASVPLAAFGQVERPPARAGRVTPPLNVEQILQGSGLGRNTGFALVDLQNGRLLEGHNPALMRPPASVSKIMTALYAQAALGNDYRFETRLLATGRLSNGTLSGDLYLIGGGDPQLDTDDLNALVMQAKAAGLQRISGRFHVVSNVLPLIRQIDEGQPVQAGYNATVSGLNLNYNRVYFEWKREGGGYKLSMDARSELVKPAVSVARISLSPRAGPAYGYERRGGVEHWSVARAALGRGGGRWLPVRAPAAYAAEVFQVLAAGQGIALPKAAPATRVPRGTVLGRVLSADLRRIQTDMLRWSNNLTAEVLGLSATQVAGGRVGSLRASAQAMGRWVARQSGTNRPNLFNHSGLSYQSRISAREMAGFLAAQSSQRGLDGILREVTLENARGDGVELPGIRVLAKSGTLDFCRGLAGYIEKNGQNRYAFAVFAADPAARRVIPAGADHPSGTRGWRDVAKTQEKALIYRWASALA